MHKHSDHNKLLWWRSTHCIIWNHCCVTIKSNQVYCHILQQTAFHTSYNILNVVHPCLTVAPVDTFSHKVTCVCTCACAHMHIHSCIYKHTYTDKYQNKVEYYIRINSLRSSKSLLMIRVIFNCFYMYKFTRKWWTSEWLFSNWGVISQTMTQAAACSIWPKAKAWVRLTWATKSSMCRWASAGPVLLLLLPQRVQHQHSQVVCLGMLSSSTFIVSGWHGCSVW